MTSPRSRFGLVPKQATPPGLGAVDLIGGSTETKGLTPTSRAVTPDFSVRVSIKSTGPLPRWFNGFCTTSTVTVPPPPTLRRWSDDCKLQRTHAEISCSPPTPCRWEPRLKARRGHTEHPITASTDTGSVGSRRFCSPSLVAGSRHPTDAGSVEMKTVTVELLTTALEPRPPVVQKPASHRGKPGGVACSRTSRESSDHPRPRGRHLERERYRGLAFGARDHG